MLRFVISLIISLLPARRTGIEAIFATGTPLEVEVLCGTLIVTSEEAPQQPPAEPEVVTQLRRVCKRLSPRRQQQIAQLVTELTTPKKREVKLRPGEVIWRELKPL